MNIYEALTCFGFPSDPDAPPIIPKKEDIEARFAARKKNLNQHLRRIAPDKNQHLINRTEEYKKLEEEYKELLDQLKQLNEAYKILLDPQKQITLVVNKQNFIIVQIYDKTKSLLCEYTFFIEEQYFEQDLNRFLQGNSCFYVDLNFCGDCHSIFSFVHSELLKLKRLNNLTCRYNHAYFSSYAMFSPIQQMQLIALIKANTALMEKTNIIFGNMVDTIEAILTIRITSSNDRHKGTHNFFLANENFEKTLNKFLRKEINTYIKKEPLVSLSIVFSERCASIFSLPFTHPMLAFIHSELLNCRDLGKLECSHDRYWDDHRPKQKIVFSKEQQEQLNAAITANQIRRKNCITINETNLFFPTEEDFSKKINRFFAQYNSFPAQSLTLNFCGDYYSGLNFIHMNLLKSNGLEQLTFKCDGKPSNSVFSKQQQDQLDALMLENEIKRIQPIILRNTDELFSFTKNLTTAFIIFGVGLLCAFLIFPFAALTISSLLGISITAFITLNGRLWTMPPGSENPGIFVGYRGSYKSYRADLDYALRNNYVKHDNTFYNASDNALLDALPFYTLRTFFIASVIVGISAFLRDRYILKSGSYYETPDEIEKVCDPSEKKALQYGLEMVTWKGYFWSYLRPETYLHPMASLGAYKQAAVGNDPVVRAIKNLKL